MTRIAEASALAGLQSGLDDSQWELDQRAATQFFRSGQSTIRPDEPSAAPTGQPTDPGVARSVPGPQPACSPVQYVWPPAATPPSDPTPRPTGRTTEAQGVLAEPPQPLRRSVQPRRPSEPIGGPVALETGSVGFQAEPRPRPVRPAAPLARSAATQALATEMPEAMPVELAALVRRVFLESDGSAVRSVLFCPVVGEPTGNVAWHVAELLAVQWQRRVAFVEDGSRPGRSASSGDSHGLITRVGWYPPAELSAATSQAAPQPQANGNAVSDVVGERVSDLSDAFDFVVFNAAVSKPDDLIPLAQQVDGAILLIAEQVTRHDSARMLADTLRAANVRLLGVVLTKSAASHQ